MIDSIVKVIRGIVRLRGGTDNTLIGNAGDRLRTEAATKREAATTLVDESTPLAGGAKFTSAFFPANLFATFTVAVGASHDGAPQGLVIEPSMDGIDPLPNGDSNSFSILANKPKQFSHGPVSYPFYRVTYTNGAMAQTAFRLVVVGHPYLIKPSSHRLGDQVVDDDDAELVKATVTARDSSGIYGNVHRTGTRLQVEAELAPGGRVIPTVGNKLRYRFMDNTNGGVAPGTVIGSTFTRIYQRTGSGIILGMSANLESLSDASPNSWFLRLVVDGGEIFSASGINLGRLLSVSGVNFTIDPTKNSVWMGFSFKDTDARWEGPLKIPMSYNSGIEVYVRKAGSSKKYFDGLIAITEET